MIQNFRVRSRIYEFPVEGETVEAARVRGANRDAFVAEARRQEDR